MSCKLTYLTGIFAHKGDCHLSDNGTEFKNTTLNEAYDQLCINIHRYICKPISLPRQLKNKKCAQFPQREHNGTEPVFLLMFGHELGECLLTHPNNCSEYYGDIKDEIILVEFNKLWEHHVAYLKDTHNRKDY